MAQTHAAPREPSRPEKSGARDLVWEVGRMTMAGKLFYIPRAAGQRIV